MLLMCLICACFCFTFFFFFFKQKTAYEMRISDWSSDVCSSDLFGDGGAARIGGGVQRVDVGDAAGERDLRHVAGERSEERRVGKESVRVDLGGRRIIKKKNTKEKEKQYSMTRV